jgi:hypothetical protein
MLGRDRHAGVVIDRAPVDITQTRRRKSPASAARLDTPTQQEAHRTAQLPDRIGDVDGRIDVASLPGQWEVARVAARGET